MLELRTFSRILVILLMVLASATSHASSFASGITYTGRITKDDAPIDSGVVRFYIWVQTQGGCDLYAEQRDVDMSGSSGTYSFEIGNGPLASSFPHSGFGILNLSDVFDNAKSTSDLDTSKTGCLTFTPQADEGRVLKVQFLPPGEAVAQALPNLVVTAVPTARMAFNSNKVGGYGTGELLKVNAAVDKSTYANTALNQAQYDEFWKLILGTSTTYLKAIPTLGGDVSGTLPAVTVTKIQNVAVTAPTTGDTGKVLTYNGTGMVWQSAAAGGITSINGLSGSTQSFATGTAGADVAISSSGSTHTINIPTASGSNRGALSSADWTTFNSKQSSSLGTGQIWIGNASGVAAAQTLSGDATVSASGNVTVDKTQTAQASKILQLDSSGNAYVNGVDIKGSGAVSASLRYTGASNMVMNLPTTSGSANQFLQTDGAGNWSWASQSAMLPAISAGQVWVGNASGGAQAFSLSGDIATVSNTGLVTLSVSATGSNKLPLAGGTMSGAIDMGNQNIANAGHVTMANNKYFNLSNYPGAAGSNAGQIWYDSGDVKYFDGTTVKTLGVAGAGITNLNGLSVGTQSFVVGSAGNSPAITSSGSAHTFDFPMASASGSVTAGLISNADYVSFSSKQGNALAAGQVWVGNASGVSQARVLSGDITIDNVGLVSLKATGSVGTYYKVVTDAQGRVVSGTSSISATDLPALNDGTIWIGNSGNTAVGYAMSGDATMSNVGLLTLKNTGSVGTYSKIVTDAQGRVVSGSALAGADVTTALGYTPVNRAGDTMSGALAMGANDISNVGNISMAANKYFGLSANGTNGTVAGQMWYDSGTIKYYDGSTVKSLGVAGAGITSLNGLSAGTQSFVVGSAGNAPTITSSGSAHTFDFPMASASGSVTAGLISNADYVSFSGKQSNALTGGQVWVGNASNVAQARALSGDIASISNVGLVTATKTTVGLANTLVSTDNFGVVNGYGFAVQGTVAGSVGILAASSTSNYTIKLPATTPVANQIMQSDASGNLSWINTPSFALPSIAAGKIWVGNSSGGPEAFALSGDIGSVSNTGLVTLKNTGTVGTYFKVVTDAQGRVSSGSALASGDVTTALGYTPANASLGYVNGGNTFGGNATLGLNDNYNLGFKTNNTTQMTISSNGNVGIGTTTPTVKLSVVDTAADAIVAISRPAGKDGVLAFATGTSQRWGVLTTTAAESGSNAGSNFAISSYDDAGSQLRTDFYINRATGKIGIGMMGPTVSLDLSAKDDAVRLPQGTTAQQPANATGLIRYNTSNNNVEFNNGSGWTALAAAGAGITTLNGLTAVSQTFATPGTSGTAPGWSFAGSTHTLNIPMSSATSVTAGLVSNADYTSMMAKQSTSLASTQVWVGNASGIAEARALSGDVTVSNVGLVTLKNTGSIGTYYKVVTDAQGRVSSGTSSLSASDLPSLADGKIWVGNSGNAAAAYAMSGDATMSNVGLLTLKNTGTIGTYWKVITDAQGRVSSGSALASGDVTTALGYTPANASLGYVNGGNTFAGNATLGTNDAYTLGFETNNTTRMTIDASGNVGIGTSAPVTALHIVSDKPSSAVHPDRAGLILESEGTSVGGRIASKVFSDTENPLFVAYRARGTKASPSALLSGDLITAVSPVGYDGSNWQTGAHVRFFSTENWSGSAIGSAITFRTVTNGTTTTLDRMRIDHNGNVGIGTTAPTSKLHVHSTANADNAVSISIAGSGNAERSRLHLLTLSDGNTLGSTSNNRGWAMGAYGNAYGTGDSNSLDISYWSGATWTTALHLGNTGNVGIGSAVPSYSLDMNGKTDAIRLPAGTTAQQPTAATGLIRYNTSNNTVEYNNGSSWNTVATSTGSTGAYVNGGNAFGGNASIGLTDNYNLQFKTNNTVKMTLTSDGKLGLGTVPGASLHVMNGSAAFEDNTNTVGGPNFSFWKNRAYTATQNLDELGYISFYGHDGSTTLRSAFILAKGDGAPSSGSVPGQIGFFTTASGSADSTERMRIVANGNVAIGAMTPTVSLDISSKTDAVRLPNGTTAQRPANAAGLLRYNTSIPGVEYNTGSGWNTLSSDANAIIKDGNSFGAHTIIGTNDNYDFRLEANGSTAMTIEPSGEIGIGTTTPGYKLDIVSTDGDALRLNTNSNTAAQGSAVMLYRSRGTAGSPTAVQSSDTLGGLYSRGYGATSYGSSSTASIEFSAAQTFTDANRGTFMAFNTTANNSSSPAEAMRINHNGYVGIGTTSPRAGLDVNATIVGKAAVSNGTSTIDYSTGNKQYTTADCGSFALHNMKDGGDYVLVVQGGTPATCTFTAFTDAGVTGLTVHMPPDNGNTTSGKHTIFNMMVVGTHLYVAWTPGY